MAAEKIIENKVKAYLKEKGAYFIKTHGGMYGTAGTPDLIVCFKGMFIGIEMKAPGKEPTALQRQHLNQIVYAGGYSFVADSLETVVEFIDAIDKTFKEKVGNYETGTKMH